MKRLRVWLCAAKDDPLVRTAGLLVADNAALSAVGGLCTVLATRLWSPGDVGAVAAVTGALGILVVACGLGMPTTIVRFLGAEERQAAFVRQSAFVTGAVAAPAALVLALVPGHLGVPVADLGLRGWVGPFLLVLYTLMSLAVVVGDPCYIARQEVSFMIAKDIVALAVRIALLLLLSGSGARGLFLVALIYVCVAGAVDVFILAVRLRRGDRPDRRRPLGELRKHFAFAIPTHVAIVASSLPIYTLPALCAAILNTGASAYVAIVLQVTGILTLVPSMTGQSLLAELARQPAPLYRSMLRALRGAYVTTLPLAFGLVIFAPYVLLIFGTRYSTGGASFLRWAAAGSVFFVFNYICDIVLLARQKVAGYVFVNVAGTIIFMALIVLALRHGLLWLGPSWFLAQGLYALISVLVVLRYVTVEEFRKALVTAGELFLRRRG